MEERIVTITTTDFLFNGENCQYIPEKIDRKETKDFVYDLMENDKGEIRYIVNKAYKHRVGSIITKKKIPFCKEMQRKVISEIVFQEQIPEIILNPELEFVAEH